MRKYIVLIIIAIIAFSWTSCNKEVDPAEEEVKLLNQYLADNQITEEPKASGLYYIESETGTGLQPQQGDTVSVHYTGKLIDGTIFDTSVGGSPFSFTLGTGYVIPGWDEGIAYMKEGGKAILIIPSILGYGSSGIGSIPPYSTLIFDVELVDVK
ncbi:MAG: FKBP-type peptidyl-prolyl cis-trans isomerase [Bacteroidetes bacterium]|nr:FKBP-type peptidyl-prolyl cis-trans isomerase [Bacteroidota bacterium]